MSLKLLGLSGSLRAGSYNTALLRAIADRLPQGATLRLHDLRPIPMYDGDLDTPDDVEALKAAIAEVDALVLATPEYNHGIPGVLKNAIDWASRPAFRSVLRDKPVGIVSASPGAIGGARVQQLLKVVMLGTGAQLFPWPEVVVGAAGTRFTDGVLTDDKTSEFLRGWAEGLCTWVPYATAYAERGT